MGFTIEIIPIYDAKSITAGYQKGMEQTNAKYKIYLHQDTFLLKKDILKELISIFQADAQIGMIGLIGAHKRKEDGYYINAWDCGSIYHNIAPGIVEFLPNDGKVTETVEAIDGFFMMTQYDVKFRTDLFDGWDFYDASQVQEMKRAGYKTVVPYQKEPYAYHNNHYSKIEHYEQYRKIYVKEYSLNEGNELRTSSEQEDKGKQTQLEKEQLGNMLIEHYITRINQGEFEDVFAELRANKALATFDCVKDFLLLLTIFDWENQFCQKRIFFAQDMDYAQMMEALQELIFFVKRVEFGMEDLQKDIQKDGKEDIEKGKVIYSDFAILAVVTAYGYHKELLKERLHLKI